jgi:hypothetical protein
MTERVTIHLSEVAAIVHPAQTTFGASAPVPGPVLAAQSAIRCSMERRDA